MTLKKKLAALMKEVIAETEANPVFRDRLTQALHPYEKAAKKPSERSQIAKSSDPKRPKNRRTPALIDPVQLAREGEPVLREALAKLDFEQLRDVVADYGMDPGKLVMKWRDADRIVDRIVEVARARALKGSAFLPQPEQATDNPDPLADSKP